MDSGVFEIRDVIDMDLEGGTLIECFPSISALALITANILLEAKRSPSEGQSVQFDQIAVGDSNQLPSICVVYYSKPKFPIRIYANEEMKVALLASEIPQYPPITREIGKKIFQWTKNKGINRIISVEGFTSDYTQSPQQIPMRVFGVGTTESCRSFLEDKQITPLDHGVIKGLSAVLLNEGWYAKSEVIVILGEVRQHYPEVRTAARIIEVLNQIIPSLKIGIEPILAQAEQIEQMSLSMRVQASEAMESEGQIMAKPDKTYI
ncbi:MAG: proteasome assembly chaperone family protein [Candidatus Hodarchaeota archaeon]